MLQHQHTRTMSISYGIYCRPDCELTKDLEKNWSKVLVCISIKQGENCERFALSASYTTPDNHTKLQTRNLSKLSSFNVIYLMFFYLISMSEIVFQFSIDQAGKLALARSPMRVKIWPGEWETGLAKWNLYKLYKRLPSWGECQKNFVSQHVDTALTLILVQLLTIHSMHRTRQTAATVLT